MSTSKLKKHCVSILDTGEQYTCSEQQHLLQGMLSLGKKGIPVGCRGGGCGVCKVQIRGDKNSFQTLLMSRAHVSEEEQLEGVVLACRTFALSDLQLNVIGGIKKKITRKTPS